MKSLTRDWLNALGNGVLLCAIMLYAWLPLLGFAAWHRVLPEHAHVLVAGGQSAGEPDASAGAFAPALQDRGNACSACRSSQPRITMVHLLSPAGALSLFELVVGCVAIFFRVCLSAHSERVPAFLFHAPGFIAAPPDPPPNARAQSLQTVCVNLTRSNSAAIF